MTIPSLLSPIDQTERIHILDILRGFAVFGILLVNITGFNDPVFYPERIPSQGFPWYDELFDFLMVFLAEGKFYTIFSFLFGLGFSVQITRARKKGMDIRSFYTRRLLILFGFGLLHAVLFWTSDILRHYALLGFTLLWFQKRSNHALLYSAAIFMVFSFLSMGLIGGPEGGDGLFIPITEIIKVSRDVYMNGTFFEVVHFQLFAAIDTFFFIVQLQGFSIMAYFLLGLLAGRMQFFENLTDKKILLRRVVVWGGLAGLAGNIVFITASSPWVSSLGFTIGTPLLAACYVSAVSLLSMHPKSAKFFASIAKVGRMALSNYVLQSVVCAVLFNGYGFGLLGKGVGAALLWGIGISIYLIQIPLSVWWLSRFQFGPLEWLWRSLTYGQRQKFLAK